jgi:hypothetical protein
LRPTVEFLHFVIAKTLPAARPIFVCRAGKLAASKRKAQID